MACNRMAQTMGHDLLMDNKPMPGGHENNPFATFDTITPMEKKQQGDAVFALLPGRQSEQDCSISALAITSVFKPLS